jgi:transposase-like protein
VPRITKAEFDARNAAQGSAGDPYHHGGSPAQTEHDEFLRIAVLAKKHGVSKATIRRWFRQAERGEDSPLPPRETLSPKVSGLWGSTLAKHQAARRAAASA